MGPLLLLASESEFTNLLDNRLPEYRLCLRRRRSTSRVNRYWNSRILAIFGSPEPDPKHHVLRAAVEMQLAASKLNDDRRLRGVPYRNFGIGIHCGEVIHGFVGTSDHMEFTVIGDAVSRTARYCSAAPEREVLISPEIHEHVWRFAETEQATIPTKHEGSLVAYRVNRLKESTNAGSSGAAHQARPPQADG